MAAKEYDLAIDNLETAITTGFPVGLANRLHVMSEHPDLDAIRDRPTFDELVRRAGLPIQSEGVR